MKKRIEYGITDETRKVIAGNHKAIADEMSWSPGSVYAVVEGNLPDPFAYFQPWYAACVRAGVAYTEYDSRQAEIRARYRCLVEPVCEKEVLLKKIADDSQTTQDIISAFRDGNLDGSERKQLRADVERLRKNCDLVEALLDFHAASEIERNGSK